MIAFFFYIDAVNTVISMSTSYGTQLGIDSTQLVIALLVTQFVAFPCAILYGRLSGTVRRQADDRDRGDRLSGYCDVRRILPENGCGVSGFWRFWWACFQGGIQALSRSYYGKIIPKDHANEYYGFYDIFGKTASVLGTFLVATTTAATGNASAGVLSIAVLLVAALVLLLVQKDPTAR